MSWAQHKALSAVMESPFFCRVEQREAILSVIRETIARCAVFSAGGWTTAPGIEVGVRMRMELLGETREDATARLGEP